MVASRSMRLTSLVGVVTLGLSLLSACADGRAADGDSGTTSRRDAAVADASLGDVDAAFVVPLDAASDDAATLDAGSSPSVDAAMPDAGVDAFVPRPVFTIRYLANRGSAWTTIPSVGEGPTSRIEAALGLKGTTQILVLTRTDVFTFDTISHRFESRVSRDSLFPELAGATLGDGYTVGHASDESLGLVIGARAGGAWIYGWTQATHTASFQHFVPVDELGSDWHQELSPPLYEMYGYVYVPENSAGWATVDAARSPCAARDVSDYIVVASTDGFGPRSMTVGLYDARGSCTRFVNKGTYRSSVYPPFALTGAPSDPFTIDALAWSSGLWVFSHD